MGGDLVPQLKDGQRYSNLPTSLRFLFSDDPKWDK